MTDPKHTNTDSEIDITGNFELKVDLSKSRKKTKEELELDEVVRAALTNPDTKDWSNGITHFNPEDGTSKILRAQDTNITGLSGKVEHRESGYHEQI